MGLLAGLLIGCFVGCLIGLFIAACGKNNKEHDLESENYFLNLQLEKKDKYIEDMYKKYKNKIDRNI